MFGAGLVLTAVAARQMLWLEGHTITHSRRTSLVGSEGVRPQPDLNRFSQKCDRARKNKGAPCTTDREGYEPRARPNLPPLSYYILL